LERVAFITLKNIYVGLPGRILVVNSHWVLLWQLNITNIVFFLKSGGGIMISDIMQLLILQKLFKL